MFQYISWVCKISEILQGASDSRQAVVQCTGRNHVTALDTTYERQ